MSDQSRVIVGAALGAVAGAVAGYLLYTEGGRAARARIESAVDDLWREFALFQQTIEKAGDLADEGIRLFHEFSAARAPSAPPSDATSH